MKENGTAPALDAGPLIMAGLHHDIIEMVGTLQVFVGRGIGQVDPAVIIPVTHCFTPAPTTPDG
jgi:hypothetical protein